MRTLTQVLFAALLSLLTAEATRASVNLTSQVFSSTNLPSVWTDEALPQPYRLRVKIGGSYHATSLYNNNWTRLESVPAPGTYAVELYWVLYDPADWTTVRQVGPFTSGTITIQPAAQPPYARTVTAAPASPGQATTITGSASDGNGDLAWLHFFTNDPSWRGYVYAGGAYVGARADATGSVAWTIPAGSATGTYQAHLRAADATGLWDWNGGATAGFSVRNAQPPVFSQNAAGAVGSPFAPSLSGGAGTGPWQWVVAGRTNWGGGQPGTLLPPANTPAATWVPDAAGDYWFWVIRQGDASYLPSNIAGPYLLSVRGNPPVILAPPAGATVNAGEAATFSVVAAGDAPLSYQWTRNGAEVPGATQARLAIAAAQPADAGSYTVTVRNGSGSVMSAAALLNVRVIPPSIVSSPSAQTVTAGQTVTLAVTAAGTPPFTYLWLRDGTALPGAAGATLVIANAQPAHGGSYAVRVSNAAGSATGVPASVSVLPAPPAIVRHPTASTVATGQTVQLSVEATGSQPLTYQWRRNGTPVPGATLAVLTLTNIQPGDAANAPGYSVLVSNSAGAAIGGPAALAVVDTPPVRLALQYWREGDFPDRPAGTGRWIEEWVWIEAHWEENGHWEDTDGDGEDDTWVVDERIWRPGELQLQSNWQEDVAPDGLLGSRWATTVGEFGPPTAAGATALTTAAADRGHVLETYRPGSGEIALRAWALAPGGNCADFRFAVLQPNGNPTGLAGSIPAGGFADIRLPTWLWGAGSYRVELTYAGANATALPSGKATYSIAVGQSLPPRILQHPSPSAQRVAAGSAAAFTAAAADAVSYQWFKDGTALPGSTGATLTLVTVSTGHAGVYLVQAINAAGRTTSDPAILEVTAGPWTDSDGDGAPDSIERLLGLNAAQPAAADSTNATLRLRIHQP